MSCAKISYINSINVFNPQCFEVSKRLKRPYYVSNYTVHNDPAISAVHDVIKIIYYKLLNLNFQKYSNHIIKELASTNLQSNPKIK